MRFPSTCLGAVHILRNTGELRLPGRAGGREGASGGSLQQLPGGEQLHSPSQAPRKW